MNVFSTVVLLLSIFTQNLIAQTPEEYRKTGIYYKNQSKYDSAIYNYNVALEGFTNANDQDGIAKVQNNLGTVWFYLDAFDKAIAAYNVSERIFKESNNEVGLANVGVGLGNYYYYHDKDYSEALVYFKKSMNTYESIDNMRMVLITSNNIGNVLSYDVPENNLYDKDEAMVNYRKALAIAYSLNDSVQMGGIHMNIAQVNQKSNEDSSLYHFQKAEEFFLNSGSEYKLASLYLNMAYFFMINNKLDLALSKNHKSFRISNRNEFIDFINGAAQNFAEIFSRTKQFDSAFHYSQIHIKTNKIIYDRDKINIIENLKISYETEKKEQELALTTAENRTLMTTLLVAVGFTIIIIVIFQLRQKALRTLREREADLRIKEQELHQQQVDQMVREQELKSINAMLEGEEKERKRIAEDLHDRVGSMLSAMKLQTDSSNKKMTGLLDETVEEVRRISHNLETKVLNRFGLVAALEDLAQKINTSEKIQFELQHLDLTERLDNKVEINSYRIVQELISNALKHSQATEIITQVNRIDNQLIITVEDNGVGFNSLEAREKASGMGLKNVMSRANELNGNFNVDSGKGNGTTITVDFPL